MKIKFLNSFTGLIVLLIVLISCKVEPQQIEYGKDQCNFCVMNIVDKTHAAQYVTKKGKQFKFDAIECMVNEVNNRGEEDVAILLVANYANPGEMINATTATYLISKEIKSPMGANLSALSSKDNAENLQQKHGGKIYTWETLKQRFLDK
ncbi:nitrous oxide reductase accessory protein NosL [Lutibacter sp.]